MQMTGIFDTYGLNLENRQFKEYSLHNGLLFPAVRLGVLETSSRENIMPEMN